MPTNAAFPGAKILGLRRTVGVRLAARVLAKEIVFITRCKSRMAIGRPDDAELIRVHPCTRFNCKAALQRLTNILTRIILWLLRGLHGQIAKVPASGAETGELVVRRQKRVRFTIALNLRDFSHGLARRTPPRILRSHWAAVRTDQFKHQSIGQVAVMRDREHFAARDLFIIVHIVPQLADRRVALAGIIGEHFVGAAFAVTEHDNAVQIVTTGHQRIFKAHERREFAGLIIAFH